MAVPKLEVDERFFEVIAQTETVALTKHRQSGAFGIWRLEWSDRGNLPRLMEADAWARFLKYTQDG